MKNASFMYYADLLNRSKTMVTALSPARICPPVLCGAQAGQISSAPTSRALPVCHLTLRDVFPQPFHWLSRAASHRKGDCTSVMLCDERRRKPCQILLVPMQPLHRDGDRWSSRETWLLMAELLLLVRGRFSFPSALPW